MDHIDEESQLSSPMDIPHLCGNLITVTADGGVILAHLSIKDYLLSGAIKNGRAFTFALSERQANAESGLKCLTYLSFAEFRSGPAHSAKDFEDRFIDHPFLDHASKWWSSYAKNAGSSSQELQSRVLGFFTPSCRPQFMSWLQVICSEVVLREKAKMAIARRKYNWNLYPKHATSLYYAASFGIEHVVHALLAEGAEVDATGDRLGATALHAAALRGHVAIMDILFQKGAEVNKSDFINKTPLHSAALMGHVDVIRYLLEHGADADKLRTPYNWAVMIGSDDVQKTLVAARDSCYK